MQLTQKQEEGLKVAVRRYLEGERYTVIAGYAGSGKTTLVRFIVQALPNITEDDVVYTSYTGKAVSVLSRMGNKNAITLHKLLYDSFPRPDGTFLRKPKKTIDYHIVVVDEISLVPKTLMDLLFSHDCYVLCCGDPAQLPPINKDEDHHLLDHPHVFLDQIVRQAEESEIIQMTMKVRNQEPIYDFKGKEVQIVNSSQLNTGMLLWADQILVATNKMRLDINNKMRQLLNKNSKEPEENDKVICLRNYWDYVSTQDNSLINGTIGYLHNKFDTYNVIPYWAGGGRIDLTVAEFITDIGENFGQLDLDTHMIMTGEKCVDTKLAYKLEKNPRTRGLVPLEFTYGYAITCHKSQGSSWGKVLVLEESFPFNNEEHARWLYTALTRAEDKLVWVR